MEAKTEGRPGPGGEYPPCPLGLWCAAREDMWARLLGFLPRDFRHHLLQARREMLLAARSLVDGMIQVQDRLESRLERGLDQPGREIRVE
ncbi:MAG: hypothetical protein K6T75_08480 [Acetobacteraceae bacterium]|nr:hypothetical protein [Acetobacteraceae bacterium]